MIESCNYRCHFTFVHSKTARKGECIYCGKTTDGRAEEDGSEDKQEKKEKTGGKNEEKNVREICLEKER